VKIGTPLSSASAVASTFNAHKPSLTLGAKIGIAVGSFLFLATILGCCIVWRGRRKRRAQLARFAAKRQEKIQVMTTVDQVPKWKEQHHDSPQSESSRAFQSQGSWQWSEADAARWQQSQQDLAIRTTESPISPSPQFFSPYTSQHNSPISPTQGQPMMRDWPIPPPPKGTAASQRGETSTSTSPTQSPPMPPITSWPIPAPPRGTAAAQQEEVLRNGERIEMHPMSFGGRLRTASHGSGHALVTAPSPVAQHPQHRRTESIGEAL
jgi:hypothetical protein